MVRFVLVQPIEPVSVVPIIRGYQYALLVYQKTNLVTVCSILELISALTFVHATEIELFNRAE